jgi:RNA-directed DNA polymerase
MGRRFDEVTAFFSLRRAARRAARGSRGSPGAAAFLCELEAEVLALQRELRAGAYEPGPFTTFPIREPKPRLISAAPFRDRVVHHAVCAVLEPELEREADPDSYACRRGRGTLAAVHRIQAHCRRWPWFAKLDVHHCFETVDLSVLRGLLIQRFPDPPLLDVLDRVLDRGAGPDGRGLPIGNLTSQHLANLLLGEVDREARRIGVGGWVRYMDDMLLFGPDRDAVTRWRDALAAFVVARLHQVDKPSARRLAPVHAGVPALGFRVWPRRIRLDGARRRRVLRRLRRQGRAVEAGLLSESEAARSAGAWIGWVGQADTLGLRRAALGPPPR